MLQGSLQANTDSILKLLVYDVLAFVSLKFRFDVRAL